MSRSCMAAALRRSKRWPAARSNSVTFAGASVIQANLSGSDLVFVAAQTNYVVLSIWTRKDSPIRTLAELAGKSIGVSAPGSATHTTTRAALRKAGVADKDMKFVHHGALPEIFVSLDKGLVDAGVASAPRPAFRELVDLATQRIPFLQGAIIVNRELFPARTAGGGEFLERVR